MTDPKPWSTTFYHDADSDLLDRNTPKIPKKSKFKAEFINNVFDNIIPES